MASATLKAIRENNLAFYIDGDTLAEVTAKRRTTSNARLWAPEGYTWLKEGNRWELHRPNTPERQAARDRLAVEPWREYFPYRPDDMPPKKGNPAALAKLLAECGEVVDSPIQT